ncbi:hypothetical protein [Streptomyces sp. SS52]|uniref:hypothetical protein n=1 Tax=Streptomyces sp. SS52 TaxID=2563602 RepID=UPI001FFB7E79|nr:hypothetical protein [Streptomyces sp. SS52]
MVTVDTRGADDAKAAAESVGKEITALGEGGRRHPANSTSRATPPSSPWCPRPGPSDAATEELVRTSAAVRRGIESDTGATMLVTA